MALDVSYKKPKENIVWKVIRKFFFLDFLLGLSVTMKHTFTSLTKQSNTVVHYPDKEKWVPYQRFRGKLHLNYDEDGKELCVGCELCSKACPTDCITVIPMEDKNNVGITDRIAKVWKWESLRCLYCGYCAEACPTTAVRLGRDFELACYSLSDSIHNKEDLLKPQSVPEEIIGGQVAKAKLVKLEKGVKVVADFEKMKDRVL